MTIDDFSEDNHLQWQVVNDNVMGGVSESSMQRLPQNTGLFAGIVSLENNGGFASCKAKVEDLQMDKISGFKIRVKGDVKVYSFKLKCRHNENRASYRVKFNTVGDYWSTHQFLLENFIATYKGKILEDEPPADPSQITDIGFLIADEQPGPFELMIDHIEAF